MHALTHVYLYALRLAWRRWSLGAGIDCMFAHLDTLPSYVWGTHIALDIIPILGMFPLASPWIIPCDSGMINEMCYAMLLFSKRM